MVHCVHYIDKIKCYFRPILHLSFIKLQKKESIIFQDALQTLLNIHLGYVCLYYNTDKLNT